MGGIGPGGMWNRAGYEKMVLDEWKRGRRRRPPGPPLGPIIILLIIIAAVIWSLIRR